MDDLTHAKSPTLNDQKWGGIHKYTTPFLIVDCRLIWRGQIVYFIISQFLSFGIMFCEATGIFPEIPIRYKKGIVKTQDLIPSGELLGLGFFSKVVEYKNNPHAFVIKKSLLSLEKEYQIGKMLNHENIAKTRALFIKEYDPTPLSIYQLLTDQFYRKQIRFYHFSIYKMVIERIHGKLLNTLYGTGLSPIKVEILLRQAQNCCLYLFDQHIRWGDLHGENIYLLDTSDQLMIADFGSWAVEEDARTRGICLFRDLQRLLFNLISTSFPDDVLNDTPPFSTSIPNLGKLDAKPTKIAEDIVQTDLNDHDFSNKTEYEIRCLLEEYCMQVIDKFQIIN